MKYFKLWRELFKEFKKSQILDALFGAVIFATLLFIPLFVMLVQLAVVYLYILTIMVGLIIIALFAYIYVLHLFWQKSLKLKQPEMKTDVKKLFLINTLIVNVFILICGIIFLYVLVPILFV